MRKDLVEKEAEDFSLRHPILNGADGYRQRLFTEKNDWWWTVKDPSGQLLWTMRYYSSPDKSQIVKAQIFVDRSKSIQYHPMGEQELADLVLWARQYEEYVRDNIYS
jgi:hypothetical protein